MSITAIVIGAFVAVCLALPPHGYGCRETRSIRYE